MQELKLVRINNCFCNAQKDVLTRLKENWKDLSISPIPDDIISLLVDSNIVAASNTHAIIATSLESTALLINKRIGEITDYLCEFLDQELLFIALSDEEWNHEKAKYVANIRSGIKYELMEEKSLPCSSEEILEDATSLEKIAQDLFDHDKIEIV